MKFIEITIAPNGETRIETKGFSGAACKDASRSIEQALGQALAEQLTAEFHEATDVERPSVRLS